MVIFDLSIVKSPTMMVANISGSFKIVDMVKVSLALLIVTYIWVIGKKISLMEKVYMCMLMENVFMANSWKERKPEEEPIIIKVAQNSKVNGKKIKKVDSVYLSILTMKNMKAIG